MNKYYSLVKNKKKREAELTIFGDITSYAWEELGQMSSYNLSKQLQSLTDVDTINVHINSYGGEVAEGLAIYNSLKNHKAKVKTYCDGFACSIASVIFMAGDERIMSNASLLMIHNAWSIAQGNAAQLRKEADDLEKITQASVNAYMDYVSISEEELKQLLDNETWLDCNEALNKGFATKITESKNNEKASQNVKQSLIKMILAKQEEESDEEDEEIIEEPETDEEVVEEETVEDEESDETDEEETEETETTEENPDEDEEPVEETEEDDENPEKDKDEDKDLNQKLIKFLNVISKI